MDPLLKTTRILFGVLYFRLHILCAATLCFPVWWQWSQTLWNHHQFFVYDMIFSLLLLVVSFLFYISEYFCRVLSSILTKAFRTILTSIAMVLLFVVSNEQCVNNFFFLSIKSMFFYFGCWLVFWILIACGCFFKYGLCHYK